MNVRNAHAANAPDAASDTLVLSYRGTPSEWREHAEHDLHEVADSGASVLVDLSAADGIDSLALGTLVLAQKRLRMKGGELALVCDRPAVLRQLSRTGLDRTFAVFAARR